MKKGYWLSRKFMVVVGSLLSLITLLLIGKISEFSFIDGFKWVLGLYLGANVAEGATTMIKGNNAPEAK